MFIATEILLESIYQTTHNWLIHIFVVLVLLDILSGTAKAFRQKVGSSNKGLAGVIKHLLVVMLVITSDIYLPIIGFSAYANIFTGSFVIQYLISVTENLGQLGVDFPPIIKDALYKLNDTSEEKFIHFNKLTKTNLPNALVVEKSELMKICDAKKKGEQSKEENDDHK